ncbi:MAG: GlsB/YeaQ/YmgE family stress response membrane protein [Methylocystis sp.]|nr:GlsB/YeaQ/YmgE family stress response membrane protein [Methylocystis sp.]
MNEPLGVLGTPHLGFLALVIIGGLAGWIAGKITGERHWLFTNILIGVAGSWLGSQLADVLGIAVRGSLGHFVAALAGSILIIFGWQRLHPKPGQGNFL